MPKKPNKTNFLADECLGLPTILAVQKAGFSVTSAREAGLSGKPDIEIIKWAIKERLVLITEDIDFGNITLYPPKLHSGVILLRFRHKSEEELHSILLELLNKLKPKDFNKTLIIVSADKYRLRKE